jgi:glucokinase
MNKYAIAFDIGGLFIKSTVLNNHGEICPDSFAIFPAKSKETKEEILEHLVFIIKQQANRILDKDFKIFGVGYAFPGPFDYVNGISYIKDVDKFEDLYEVNLRTEILSRLQKEPSFKSKMNDQFHIVFENDANLFALGEQIAGNARNYRRSFSLTIGTGAGSAFIDNGKLVVNRHDVPQHGWIYNLPFGNSIVDEYISKRGILRLAEELGITVQDNEVKTLAEMARKNLPHSREVFHRFGNNIGKILNDYVLPFKPDVVILGGQIAKSNDLFIDGIYETLSDKSLVIKMAKDSSLSSFVGVANLLQQTMVESNYTP